jgi:hypothetical protein
MENYGRVDETHRKAKTMISPPDCTECQDQHPADFRVTFSDNGNSSETTLCRDHAHMAASSAIHGDSVDGIEIERLDN